MAIASNIKVKENRKKNVAVVTASDCLVQGEVTDEREPVVRRNIRYRCRPWFIHRPLSLSIVRLRNLSDRVRNPTGTFSIRFLKFRQIRRISCCYRLLLLAFQSIYRCSTCAYYRDVVGGSFSDSYNRAVYFPPRMHRGRRDRWCLFLSAPSTYGFNTQYQRVCVWNDQAEWRPVCAQQL